MILGLVTCTRTRYAAPTWGTDGRPVAGTPTTTTFAASVQPDTSKAAQALLEGERYDEALKLYTVDPAIDDLRVPDQHSTLEGDRVTVDGVVYHVRQSRSYRSSSPIPHIKAILLRPREA